MKNLLKSVISNSNWAKALPSSLAAILFTLIASVPAFAQTTYNLTTTGSVTWSTPSVWTPASGPGTTFPGSGGTGNTDIANLNNLTATTSGTYDAGATGFLGQLNMTQNVSTINTTLTLTQNLTLQGVAGNEGSLWTTQSGTGTIAGQETINLGNSTLDIAAGGTFTLGSTTLPATGTGTLSSASTSTPITTTGSGAVVIDGTLLMASNAGAGYTQGILAPVTLNSSGTINIFDGTASTTVRLIMESNFTSTSGSTITASGAFGSAGASLFFEGATTTIASGTTISGFGTSTGAITFINLGTSAASQTANLGVLVPDIQVRNANLAGTVGSPVTLDKIFTSTAVSGTITNAINQIGFNNSKVFSNLVFVLGSNLNLAPGNSTPFITATFNQTGAQETIDLAGFTYNATTASGTTVFTAPTTLSGTTQFNIINSGTSSISGGNGILEAASFAMGASDTSIGSGVILQATSSGSFTNLGKQAGGVTAIDPTSIFYYTGTGTGTLTSNRTIGRVDVGTGSSASTLQLSGTVTTLTVGSDVTVNTGATIDLNGQALTESGTTGAANGGLNGTGTILNNSTATTAAVTLNTAHGNGSFSGVIKDNTSGTGTVSLIKAGSGTQTLSGANTFTGGTTVNAGALNVTGSLAATGALTVGNGATFALGKAAGGVSFNTQVTSALTLNTTTGLGSEAVLKFDLGATTADNISTGAFNITSGQEFNLVLSETATPTANETLLTWTSGTGITNILTQIDLTGSDSGITAGNLSLVGNSLVFDGAAVPEPGTWAMMLGGLALLVVLQRRRRNSQE